MYSTNPVPPSILAAGGPQERRTDPPCLGSQSPLHPPPSDRAKRLPLWNSGETDSPADSVHNLAKLCNHGCGEGAGNHDHDVLEGSGDVEQWLPGGQTVPRMASHVASYHPLSDIIFLKESMRRRGWQPVLIPHWDWALLVGGGERTAASVEDGHQSLASHGSERSDTSAARWNALRRLDKALVLD